MRLSLITVLSAAMFAVALPVLAHHASQAEFDKNMDASGQRPGGLQGERHLRKRSIPYRQDLYGHDRARA